MGVGTQNKPKLCSLYRQKMGFILFNQSLLFVFVQMSAGYKSAALITEFLLVHWICTRMVAVGLYIFGICCKALLGLPISPTRHPRYPNMGTYPKYPPPPYTPISQYWKNPSCRERRWAGRGRGFGAAPCIGTWWCGLSADYDCVGV